MDDTTYITETWIFAAMTIENLHLGSRHDLRSICPSHYCQKSNDKKKNTAFNLDHSMSNCGRHMTLTWMHAQP